METANMYLEMSGYSLDTAIQFYFEGGAGGGMEQVSSPLPSSIGGSSDDVNHMKLLFQGNNPPESWLCQGLAFDYCSENSSDWSGIGICQRKNGPCGVLVAFQATVIANLIDGGRLVPSVRVTDEDIVQAICDIVMLCKDSQDSVSICTWADPVNGVGKALEVIEISVSGDDKDSVNMIVFSVVDQFKSPGGEWLPLSINLS